MCFHNMYMCMILKLNDVPDDLWKKLIDVVNSTQDSGQLITKKIPTFLEVESLVEEIEKKEHFTKDTGDPFMQK